MNYRVQLKLLFGLMFLILAGCQQPELQSEWKSNPINIDGRPEDWQRISSYHVEEPPLGIALCNDHEFLYLRLTTHDRRLQRQIRSGGLTVWFDPQGEQEKVIGIGFPLARKVIASAGGLNRLKPKSPDDIQLHRPDDRFELSTSGKKLGKYPVLENRFAVSLALGTQQSGLVYELKVPLAGDRLFSQAIVPSALLGIGLKIGQPHISTEPREQMRQGKGAGKTGMGGISGGGSGGMKRPGGNRQEPLEFWLKAQLAEISPDKG